MPKTLTRAIGRPSTAPMCIWIRMGTTTAAQWQNVASKATSGGSENDIIKTERIKVLEEKKAKIIALHKRHIDLHKEAKRVL